MYLAFGMIVVGSDGVEVSTLDRALVDPARRQLTHVVVWSPRLQADVLVPLGLVQGSTNRRLLLHSTSSALENMPRYEAGRTELPPFHRVVLETRTVWEAESWGSRIAGADSFRSPPSCARRGRNPGVAAMLDGAGVRSPGGNARMRSTNVAMTDSRPPSGSATV